MHHWPSWVLHLLVADRAARLPGFGSLSRNAWAELFQREVVEGDCA